MKQTNYWFFKRAYAASSNNSTLRGVWHVDSMDYSYVGGAGEGTSWKALDLEWKSLTATIYETVIYRELCSALYRHHSTYDNPMKQLSSVSLQSWVLESLGNWESRITSLQPRICLYEL